MGRANSIAEEEIEEEEVATTWTWADRQSVRLHLRV